MKKEKTPVDLFAVMNHTDRCDRRFVYRNIFRKISDNA